MEGYYYLHSETKDLIFKKFEPEYDSDFVQKVWALDTTDRTSAWTIVLEALALGAKVKRIKELSAKWKLTFNDSVELLKRVTEPSKLMQDGIVLFATKILDIEEEAYWDKVKKAW